MKYILVILKNHDKNNTMEGTAECCIFQVGLDQHDGIKEKSRQEEAVSRSSLKASVSYSVKVD